VGLEGRDGPDPQPAASKLNADVIRRISRENGSLFFAIASFIQAEFNAMISENCLDAKLLEAISKKGT
jgi:hypothetical protein